MKSKNTLALIAGLTLALTGLNAQEAPTLDERIENAWKNRKSVDWASSEMDALANDILAVSPSEIKSVGQAGQIIINASADPGPKEHSISKDTSSLSSEAWTWLQNAASESNRIAVIVAVRLENDLSKLPEDYKPHNVVNFAIHTGPYTFAEIKEHLVGRGGASGSYRKAFKKYRSTLSESKQIALTLEELKGLENIVDRTKEQDKRLTELSAEYMSKTLRQ